VTLFFQPTHHAGGRIEAKSAAAAQNQGVYVLHSVAWVQQIRLSCARRCTPHIDTGNASKWRKYDCAARRTALVSMVSDLDTLNCGECVVVHDLLSIH
jgi:hypothetical protein